MDGLKIKENIYYVGVQDWDRSLFDELIPLPDGTSYNAYIIIGSEKTVLIDTAEPYKKEQFYNNLDRLELEKVDYIVSNHAEQDHSGLLKDVLDKYPDSKLVTNAKCRDFLKDLLLIEDDKFHVIEDRETLSLGDKTLEFILFPWVHWPETMLTYLKEDKILFPCDLFGSHLATTDLFVTDRDKVYKDAKRYYAEIMMPFRNIIKKNIGIIEDLDIEIIAPCHGPLYNEPGFIIDAYKEWISDEIKNEVIIPYVSMHGSTEAMIEYIINRLTEKQIPVKPFNLTKSDIGELAIELVDAATVIIGTPTVLAGGHPAVANAVFLLNALKPKVQNIGIVCSYGWGGKAIEQIKNMITYKKMDIFEPVYVKGHPKKDDYKQLDNLVEEIIKKHKGVKLV